MSHVFPYGITLQEGGRVALFPAAEVSFPTADGEYLSLFLIIDSGATISALPKSDATILGIDYEQGSPMTVSGIGSTFFQGRRHEITARIGNEEIKLPLVFLDSIDAPRVLGREGVFDRFIVIFDEARRKSTFVAAGAKDARRIQEIVDAL